jgi:hypothetical protein
MQWRNIARMKVATGKVVGGKVVLEGEPLAEGSVVTVVAWEEDETFQVSPQEEKALLAAITQAEQGEVISWEELRERLRGADEPVPTLGEVVSLRFETMSLLSMPRFGADRVATLKKGQHVRVLETRSDGWVRARADDGAEGWAINDWLIFKN